MRSVVVIGIFRVIISIGMVMFDYLSCEWVVVVCDLVGMFNGIGM